MVTTSGVSGNMVNERAPVPKKVTFEAPVANTHSSTLVGRPSRVKRSVSDSVAVFFIRRRRKEGNEGVEAQPEETQSTSPFVDVKYPTTPHPKVTCDAIRSVLEIPTHKGVSPLEAQTSVEKSPVLTEVGKWIEGVLVKPNSKSSVFDVNERPKLTVPDYLVRLISVLQCSETIGIPVAIYMMRYARGSGIDVSWRNVHKLLLTSILVAFKFWEDKTKGANGLFSTISNLPVGHIQLCEMAFLTGLAYELTISEQDKKDFLRQFERNT